MPVGFGEGVAAVVVGFVVGGWGGGAPVGFVGPTGFVATPACPPVGGRTGPFGLGAGLWVVPTGVAVGSDAPITVPIGSAVVVDPADPIGAGKGTGETSLVDGAVVAVAVGFLASLPVTAIAMKSVTTAKKRPLDTPMRTHGGREVRVVPAPLEKAPIVRPRPSSLPPMPTPIGGSVIIVGISTF